MVLSFRQTHLFKSYPVRPGAFETWDADTPAAWPPCRLASLPPAAWPPCRLASLPPPGLPAAWPPCRLASLPPRQRQRRVLLALKPGAQNGPGAQTASAWSSWRSRRASWRPRRPPDGHPGAPGAKDPPGAQDGPGCPSWRSTRASWRRRRPMDKPPGVQDGL